MPLVVSITEITAQQAPADGLIVGPPDSLVVSVVERVAVSPTIPAVIEVPLIPPSPMGMVAPVTTVQQPDGFLLLADGKSYLLLSDGVSKLILTQGWTGSLVLANVSVREIEA